jgi:selenocysteine lyase/cysteine desulfurase
VLGPGSNVETLPIASFVVEGVLHALVAARLSAEFAIGVRHGCFCATYLVRLLGLGRDELARFRAAARRHDHSALPGAVRASAGISTTSSDLERLLEATQVVATTPPPVEYVVDPATGNYLPPGLARPDGAIGAATGCARG